MKKLVLLSFLLFYVILGISQESISKKDKIIELLEMNNNSKYFTDLISINIEKISIDKQDDFRNEINTLAEIKKNEAIDFFIKKYSKADINAIYNDYSVPNQFSYSQKTLSFLREWKTYKLIFKKEFNAIITKY